MNRTLLVIFGFTACFFLGYYIKETKSETAVAKKQIDSTRASSLGAFSISLSVKNLDSSKQFYENLGFSSLGGDMKSGYLIMKNGNALIGIFQGMFDGYMLTFNPGWDENAKQIDSFTDIRKIQQKLKSKATKLISEADEKTTGPASVMLKDPDGNMILLDQHTK